MATGSRAEVLRAAGVYTIDDLAAWDGPAPEEWQGNGFEDVVVIAKAWLGQVPLVRRRPEVTVRRADVEVDVDMESYQEHGAYLWGTLLTADGVTQPYRPFVTWDPLPTRDEGRSFAEFWGWLMADQGGDPRGGQDLRGVLLFPCGGGQVAARLGDPICRDAGYPDRRADPRRSSTARTGWTSTRR